MAKCDNCGKEAVHIVIKASGEYCENCGGLNATGGVATGGLSSRNTFEIRNQQREHEGDFVQPFVPDSNTGRQIINEEFIKLYPDQAHHYYNEDELEQAGMGDLAKKVVKDREEFVKGQDDSGVEFKGDIDEETVKQIATSKG